MQGLHALSPVRLRLEVHNHLTNRFRPDSDIRTPGILSLDDDIYIPCQVRILDVHAYTLLQMPCHDRCWRSGPVARGMECG